MFSYTLTYTVQKRYVKHAQLIELEEYASFLDAHDSIDFPETAWPRSLLYLCDWSYATTSCLDATTGASISVAPASNVAATLPFSWKLLSLEYGLNSG